MDKKTIQQFLNDELTSKERELVMEWLTSHENEHEANAVLKKHWEEVNKERTAVNTDLDVVFSRLLDEIQDEVLLPIKEGQKKSDRQSMIFLPTLMKYAAVVLVTLGVAFVIWDQGGISGRAKELATIVKETSKGQKSQILLKDGSKVHLNSDSKLVYNEGFGETNRDLTLFGEAYFEVCKNPALPFTVIANNTFTTAIGTRFNIAAYAENKVTAISLTEGKVSVRPADTEQEEMAVLLTPGEEYQVGEDPHAGLIRNFEEAQVIAWKDNVLRFDNCNMESLIADLERWYNVKVVVLDPSRMSGVRANGKFDNESLQNVLRVLSYSLQFDYQINNDTVTIQFN